MPIAWAWLAALISSNSSSSASIIVQLLHLTTYNSLTALTLFYINLFISQRVNPNGGIPPMTPGSYKSLFVR